MAELHVQPKRNNFWWLWLLLAIIIIAGLIYYFNYYKKGKTIEMKSPADSAYILPNSTNASVAGVELISIGKNYST